MDFDWDDANLEHIARHDVDDLEAEDALMDEDGRELSKIVVGRETRFAYLGRTEAGRLLAVITTIRNGKIRIVTARDADDREKRMYRRA
ncbi:BrnT family toxin [Deinococcus sp.]|uniref:BrnT family toxin n=1 Tax=Deinococcus sp. TaxID=47478 RepID=UPI0025E3025A|nr:BrnT family toxin [Deinococcus sp.]